MATAVLSSALSTRVTSISLRMQHDCPFGERAGKAIFSDTEHTFVLLLKMCAQAMNQPLPETPGKNRQLALHMTLEKILQECASSPLSEGVAKRSNAPSSQGPRRQIVTTPESGGTRFFKTSDYWNPILGEWHQQVELKT